MSVRVRARALAVALAVAALATRAVAPVSAQAPGEPVTTEADESLDTGDAGADAAGVTSGVIVALETDAAAVIALGPDFAITAGELYDALDAAPLPLQRAYALDPALVQALLDRMVSDRLLAWEARRLGLDRDPGVRAAIDRALVSRLRATIVNPAVGDASRVSADDVRAFYDAHPERFHTPERRRARVVFTTDEALARRLLRQVHSGGRRRPPPDFAAIATRENVDPDLSRRHGEIDDVTLERRDLDLRLRQSLFALGVAGDFARHVVPGAWNGVQGFFVVQLVTRRPAIERTLGESADWIRQRLVLERRVAAERLFVERLATVRHVERVPLGRVLRFATVDGGASPFTRSPAAAAGSVQPGG